MGKIEPQVRFSIPDFEGEVYPEVSSVTEEASLTGHERNNDNDDVDKRARRGHLVDMQSKVMIDVPEDIWKYHLHRRTKSMDGGLECNNHSGKNPNKVNKSGHARSKSLQSIIVETMQSYQNYNNSTNNYTTDESDPSISFSQVSPLQLTTPTKKSKAQNLYLSSESPLNKYKMPIPAQISLPPFLSPENRHRRTRSVVYDGSGYSPYVEGEVSISDSEYETSNQATTEEEEGVSDNSIPSANYDISFDPNTHDLQETDNFLGIDSDANVNLKVQNRNLRLNRTNKPGTISPSRNNVEQKQSQQKQPETVTIIPQPTAPQHRRTKSNASPQGSTSKLRTNENRIVNKNFQPSPILKRTTTPSKTATPPQNSSLKILATPSKTIDIPDLEKLATPGSAHSRNSLKFFDQFDDSQEKPEYVPENVKRIDNMDTTFKFPAITHIDDVNKEAVTIPSILPEDNNDFLKIDQSPTNPQFEMRRQRLLQQSNNNPKSHMHRRSRSIHTAEDTNIMFAATSTPPKDGSIDFEVPQRSPLRPKSPTLSIHNIPEVHKEIDEIPKIEIVPTDNEESSNESILPSPIVEPPQIFEDTQDSYQFVGVHDISASDQLNVMSREENLATEENENERVMNPLTSFASFTTPLRIGQKSAILVNGQVPVQRNDSIFDSNVMSTSGSVSSRTSIFSKNSRDTALTSNPSNYDIDNSQPTKRDERNIHNKPIKSTPNHSLQPSTRNDNFQFPKRQNSVFEKIGNKVVEVIVLDDEEEEESNNENRTEVVDLGQVDKNIRKKSNSPTRPHRTTIFRENELLLDKKTKEAKRRSFHEAHKNYEDILSLCEETAETAKEVIYLLNKQEMEGKISIHPFNSLSYNSESSMKTSSKKMNDTVDIRRVRYLENFNRKLRVNSHTRSKSTINS